MRWTFLRNWQITGLWVVVRLYESADERSSIAPAGKRRYYEQSEISRYTMAVLSAFEINERRMSFCTL